MLVNANFGERIVIETLKRDWISSPVPGVKRNMLDRLGAKDARASSMLCVMRLAHLLHRMNIRSEKSS